jgi:uncharacterized membrane protein
MSRYRAMHYLLGLFLCLAMFVSLGGDQVALAARQAGGGALVASSNQEEPPAEEYLDMVTKYPVVRAKSGEKFEFEVQLRWYGKAFREFDIDVSGPPKWDVAIEAGLGTKVAVTDRIGLQAADPDTSYPVQTLFVVLTPPKGQKPAPGEYPATFEIGGGDIYESVELTAVVTALYQFDFYTATGRLNTEVTAGEDNYLTVRVENTGSIVLDSVRFSSGAMEGWVITFNPDPVESLEPGLAQEVTVNIKPPDKTIAGDYAITLFADSEEYSADPLKMRVTVLTPTIWGWVGILIVLAVIAGLAVIFRRLGRR